MAFVESFKNFFLVYLFFQNCNNIFRTSNKKKGENNKHIICILQIEIKLMALGKLTVDLNLKTIEILTEFQFLPVDFLVS